MPSHRRSFSPNFSFGQRVRRFQTVLKIAGAPSRTGQRARPNKTAHRKQRSSAAFVDLGAPRAGCAADKPLRHRHRQQRGQRIDFALRGLGWAHTLAGGEPGAARGLGPWASPGRSPAKPPPAGAPRVTRAPARTAPLLLDFTARRKKTAAPGGGATHLPPARPPRLRRAPAAGSRLRCRRFASPAGVAAAGIAPSASS